ncbi:MAG: hypothetical protein WC462_03025 [archaeon]
MSPTEFPQFTILPRTRIILTGTHFDLTSPGNLQQLKNWGVKKVFFVFPTSQKQLDLSGEFRASPAEKVNLMDIYAKFKINPMIATILPQNGIQITSLLRNPRSFRSYESFNKEAKEVNGKFIIQCMHGRHASAAYALYHLANSTNYSMQEIHKIFFDAGFKASELERMESFLQDAKVNLHRIIEEREKVLIAQKKSLARHLKKKMKHIARGSKPLRHNRH